MTGDFLYVLNYERMLRIAWTAPITIPAVLTAVITLLMVLFGVILPLPQ